ncbi:hypothetical protein BDN67DRAFT_736807 [Paxillus ammoniavirescens]|nr:hypothetical protein BDN67DRAFT_736807 [Paxillus ammoniavirescens]
MESLIWVFVWSYFQYKDGEFNCDHGPLDVWARVDAGRCAAVKHDFLNRPTSHLNYANRSRPTGTRFFDHLDSICGPGLRRRRHLESVSSFLAESQERGLESRNVTYSESLGREDSSVGPLKTNSTQENSAPSIHFFYCKTLWCNHDQRVCTVLSQFRSEVNHLGMLW